MASFASVAQSGSSGAFSPTHVSASSPIFSVANSTSPKHPASASASWLAIPSTISHTSATVSCTQPCPSDLRQPGSFTSRNLTVVDVSKKTDVSESNPTLNHRLNSSEVLAAKTQLDVKNRQNHFVHKRGLKGKHKKSRKLKFTNVKKIRKPLLEHTITVPHVSQGSDEETNDYSTRSSVCSESQPLPIIHRDMDWDNEVLDLGLQKGLKR